MQAHRPPLGAPGAFPPADSWPGFQSDALRGVAPTASAGTAPPTPPHPPGLTCHPQASHSTSEGASGPYSQAKIQGHDGDRQRKEGGRGTALADTVGRGSGPPQLQEHQAPGPWGGTSQHSLETASPRLCSDVPLTQLSKTKPPSNSPWHRSSCPVPQSSRGAAVSEGTCFWAHSLALMPVQQSSRVNCPSVGHLRF